MRVVSGIISYSRWPAALENHHFCIAGNPTYLRDPQDRLSQVDGRALSYRSIASDEPDWPTGCNILYLGASIPSAERRKLLGKAIGLPILTIIENDALCADATMFCLSINAGDVALQANLDAISRSGMRINPKVLQIVQRRKNQHESD